jgi:peptidoglycan/xylan/chitin deacetylase (PgdA/CDA1 family)
MRLLAVNHHYYRAEAPLSGIYPITPVAFETQIKELAATWQIARERDLINALADPQADAALCVITFDDGLKEQMAAARLLVARGLAGIFFVSTRPLVEQCVLDVHKLHMIRAARSDAALAPSLQALFGKAFDEVDVEAARRQYKYDDDTARQVKYFLNFVLDGEARAAWTDSVFAELFGDEKVVAASLYMDREDVRELSRLGMLGTHAHSHLPLATLTDANYRHEIALSLEILAGFGAHQVRGISYPFGGPTAVSDAVGRAAAECGLAYGFTMTRGVNEDEDFARPMQLKRISTSDLPV